MTGLSGPKGRGRPARRYVVTSRGQAALSHRYSELASQALRFLAETAGPQAVQGFAEQRVRDLEERHAAAVAAAGDDVAARVRVLADGLTADGYAASARPVPGGMAMQLCQGHCPVQDVAHEFPAAVRGRGAGVLAAPRRARAAPRDAGRRRPRLHHEHPLTIARPPRPTPCPPRALRGRTISMSAQTDSTAAATPPQMTQDEAIASIGNYNYGWHDADTAGVGRAPVACPRPRSARSPRSRTSPSGCSRRA